MATQFRVQTEAGGCVSGHQVSDGSWQSSCDSCGHVEIGRREQVESEARIHLATRVNCAYPMH